MSIVLEFLALIVLRRKEPALARPFRIPGPEWVPIMLGLLPTILIGFALYLARNERQAGMSALAFSLLIAAGGVPMYGLAWLRRSRHTKAALTV